MSGRLFEVLLWGRQHGVAIPEVDAFLDEYRALCARHGMCFTTDSDEGDAWVTLAATNGDDLAAFGGEMSLNKSRGVPAVDRARAAAQQRRDEANKRACAEAILANLAAEEAEEAEQLAMEDEVRQNGVRLADGLYRLVKVET